MKLLIICLLASALCSAATHERRAIVDNVDYLVQYEVPECAAPDWGNCSVSIPAMMPPGHPHYSAKITVFLLSASEGASRTAVIDGVVTSKIQIGQSFAGQYTDKGCLEDDPEKLVRYATKHRDDEVPEKREVVSEKPLTSSGTGIVGNNNFLYISNGDVVFAACLNGQISLDPVIVGEEVVIHARICKNGTWTDVKVRVKE